jgi:hypothetical protein
MLNNQKSLFLSLHRNGLQDLVDRGQVDPQALFGM